MGIFRRITIADGTKRAENVAFLDQNRYKIGSDTVHIGLSLGDFIGIYSPMWANFNVK